MIFHLSLGAKLKKVIIVFFAFWGPLSSAWGETIETKCAKVFETSSGDTQNNLSSLAQAWLSEEVLKGVPSDHQKKIVWGKNVGTSTQSSVLFIHGLYNSPFFMKSLLPAFADQNSNILMTRLSGHFEVDYGELRKSINWRVWLNQAEADFALARKLGQKVILVGHSTGGLLATWLAIRYPQDVESLILFSPAYGVAPWTQFFAWISDVTGISFTRSTGQILVGHAGREVNKATKYFAQWLRRSEKKQEQFLAEQLRSVPIWMNNTKIDLVINQRAARKFFAQVNEEHPLLAAREEHWIPLGLKVMHDQITTERNPSLQLTIDSIRQFLKLQAEQRLK